MKVGVLSFALSQGVMLALVGLMCGILYSFGGLIIDVLVTLGMLSAAEMSTPGLSFGTVLAFGALLGMPLIFAGLGFIAGVIEALLYNVYARWFGGIKLDFESEEL